MVDYPTPPTIGKRALFLGSKGFAVFPLFTIENGQCSCSNPNCTDQGKHPIGSLVPQGFKNADTDQQIIREWWSLYPDANIGIATGDVSQVVVLDVDVKSGGETSLAILEERMGQIPDTWCVLTGGGGMHLYFRMPDADVRNSVSAVAPGIDVRGNGGYVVAPPSHHISGESYRWSAVLHPKKVDLAPVPEWLLKRMLPRGAGASETKTMPTKIKEGERNNWMTSVAGSMRRKGFCGDAIYAAIAIENRRRCVPPMDDREVRRIANSVERYAPETVLRVHGSAA